MGARKTAGLSRDSAYEGAGLAAPLLYYGIYLPMGNRKMSVVI